MLCPSRPRAILPHDCDQRYGRDEYASDVTDTEDECECVSKRRGRLLDKTKKKRHGRRIVFNTEKIVHYYQATIYFGAEPSPYSTKSDHYQRLPTSMSGMSEERVDPGAMLRVNDSHLVIPDTRRGYESSLPFRRQGIWDLARAVAISRAIYLEFLLLLSDEIGDHNCQYSHVMTMPDIQVFLRDAHLTNRMNKLFFFYLNSVSETIFICDRLTLRHMWQCDEDINSVNGPGAYTTVVGATASYGVFLDAYPWGFGSHGNGFASRSSCMNILRCTEARAELINSPIDWKFYRRWRSGEKAKMWDERYPWKTEKAGGVVNLMLFRWVLQWTATTLCLLL